jgi:hypothetical protein
VPFGGVKHSGYDHEGDRFSMEEMTELKWITLQRGQRAFRFNILNVGTGALIGVGTGGPLFGVDSLPGPRSAFPN